MKLPRDNSPLTGWEQDNRDSQTVLKVSIHNKVQRQFSNKNTIRSEQAICSSTLQQKNLPREQPKDWVEMDMQHKRKDRRLKLKIKVLNKNKRNNLIK